MAEKIIRINMTDLSTKVESVPAGWMGLGGRGLTNPRCPKDIDVKAIYTAAL